MLKHLTGSAAIITLALSATPAMAQDAVELTVGESEEYGSYLADGEGRALYLFTTDTQGTGDSDAQVSCEGECLDAWPPVYSEGEPQAGDQVDAEMIGTLDHEGQMMVTYNGWPLYYFSQDEGSDEPTGHEIESFGGEWYLVSPAGEQIEGEE
ncbi:COG4315 family predicted lipoprotein [Chelativorans sp. YIM 93263]|uniref:COG4315 family predicted lipoprotein n=1 Tax=Chelativorans sp. YIM 93263 TaxID=2906648 RepID=UPI00237958A7|nr:hypothetical protein [Chelativorans sp. YIM 93263]